LEGFFQSQKETIKRFITDDTLTFRRLNTHNTPVFPNVINCIGSSNRPFTSIFRDSSGERRFIQLWLRNDLEIDEVQSVILDDYGKDATSLYETIDTRKTFDNNKDWENISQAQAKMKLPDICEEFLDSDDFRDSVDSSGKITKRDVYDSYRKWMIINAPSSKIFPINIFGEEIKYWLDKIGFIDKKSGGKRFWQNPEWFKDEEDSETRYMDSWNN